MIPLILDFETYYSEGYTLARMPTMQYLRDPRFQCLGVAVQVVGKPARWVPGDRVEETLARLPWERIELIAHNAAFDGALLVEKYGHRPARYYCTALAARYLVGNGVLGPEQTTSLKACAPLVGMEKGDLDASLAEGILDEYATRDAEICAALYTKYSPFVPPQERDYMSIHVQMAAEPVFHLDTERLQALADQDKALGPLFKVVRKDDQFAALLLREGVQPKWKTTAKGTFKLATSKTDGWLETLSNHESPRVRRLVEIRQKASSTIERTRAQRFLDVGSPLPSPVLYYGAHTGRGSGLDKINVQNLPRKDGLRQCIVAPPGYKLVIIDSSQIEVRVTAWLAGQEDLLQVFRDGRDPYIEFAAEYLYFKAYEDVTNDERQVGKAAVLALGFAQGEGGFVGYCENFGIPMTVDQAANVVQAYRSAYTAISGGTRPPYRTRTGLWWSCEDEVRRTGKQVLPSGRVLTYPNLSTDQRGLQYLRAAIFRKAKSEGPSNLWHGVAVENKVQAVARDVVFHQTARLWRAGWPVALMVHDEAVMVVPEDRAEECAAAAGVSFGSAPSWAKGLPVAGKAEIKDKYGK